MSNKTQLESNNKSLDDLFTKINEITTTISTFPDREDIDYELNINGMIKEYQVLAGENINAGDFIEFVVNYTKTIDTQYKPFDSNFNGYYIDCHSRASCVLLEPNKVFIAHASSQYAFLHATVVVINGTNITVNSKRLNTTQYNCYYAPNCVLLDSNKVFIITTDKNRESYATLVQIENMNFTYSQPVSLLAAKTISEYSPKCLRLDSNKVFLAHQYGNHYLYGTIVTISGTISNPSMKVTTTQLNSDQFSCYIPVLDCILLENNKVFIAHSYSYHAANQYLYGTIVTIHEEMLMATTNSLITSSSCVQHGISCVLLAPNKVFITYSHSTDELLGAAIVQINGVSASVVSQQVLDETAYSCSEQPNCVLVQDNIVFISHSYGEYDKYLYGTVVTIDGLNIRSITES